MFKTFFKSATAWIEILSIQLPVCGGNSTSFKTLNSACLIGYSESGKFARKCIRDEKDMVIEKHSKQIEC